ncbi:MAG: hypothetical protein ACYDCG_12020 [Candidatus Acidiferrales bacterium]
MLIDVLRFCCLKLTPDLYQVFYWPSRLVTNVATYAILLEIFRNALRYNPGMARIARKLLGVLFVFAVTFAASDFLHRGFSSLPRATADVGRYLLYLQGALLFVMLWLLGRYRISFGRNLLGITAGYSLSVGLDVVNFAFLAFPGNESSIGLRKLLPITYIVTLAIWCTSLWSCHPDTGRQNVSAIDRDYESLASKTKANFAHLSARLARTLKS